MGYPVIQGPYDQLESGKFLLDNAGLPAIRHDQSQPKDIRFDPSSNNPIYIGLNYIISSANTASSSWVIYKLTSNTQIQMKENVAWDDRATLF